MRFITAQAPAKPPANAAPHGIQAMAIGMSRCSTTSMQVAFEEHLDLGPCMHMARCLPHIEKISLAYRAQQEPDKAKRQALLAQFLDGCASTADFPGILFVEDLIEMYPDAKLVLNIRKGGREAWYKSIMSALGVYGTRWYEVACWWSPTDLTCYKMHALDARQMDERTGGKVKRGFFDLERYEVHNAIVREAAKKHGRELLEFEPSMGWEPLCRFLGKEIPVGVEFPRTNDNWSMQILKVILLGRGIVLWIGVLGAPFLAWWTGRYVMRTSGWVK